VPKRSWKLGQNPEAIKKILLEAADAWLTSSPPKRGHVVRRFSMLEYGDRIINYLTPKVGWTELISAANAGDRDAEATLCGKAALLIDKGEKIPAPLATYISSKLFNLFLAQGARRGRSGDANVVRNIVIVNFVSILAGNEVPPTRNDASRDKGGEHSGCSLVAEVLQQLDFDINERGVEEVWRKRKSWMIIR
jgi:hypothetical protein